jgi:hypothetical protein
MARFNPSFTGLLVVRRVGLGIGGWLLGYYGVFIVADLKGYGPIQNYATGFAWGVALLSFFSPAIRDLGTSDKN